MAELEMPFFDPILSELQRRLALQTEQGVADLELRGDRLTEDYHLLLGSEEAPGRFRRQLQRDTERTAGNVAGRGFHGEGSGIMRKKLGRLGRDQADALGQFHRQYAREQEDIQRAISGLEQQGILGVGEGVRQGAGRSSDRLTQRLPF